MVLQYDVTLMRCTRPSAVVISIVKWSMFWPCGLRLGTIVHFVPYICCSDTVLLKINLAVQTGRREGSSTSSNQILSWFVVARNDVVFLMMFFFQRGGGVTIL